MDLEQTSVACNRDSDAAEADTNTPEGNKSGGTPSTSGQLDDTVKDSSKQSSSLGELT